MRDRIDLQFAKMHQAQLRAGVRIDRDARIHRAEQRRAAAPRVPGSRLSLAR